MKRFAIPFLDVMTLLVLVLLLLIFAALMKVNDDATKAKIDTTSKYLLTLQWADGSRDDVDLSLKVPTGEVVLFQAGHRQAAFASLDHDDLGMDANTLIDDSGKSVTVNRREEVIFIRQILAGTYTANVHLYHKSEDTPAKVTVTLVGVEPSWHKIATREIILSENHEEHTAFRMTFDEKGDVVSTDLTEELFINEILGERP